MSKRIDVGGIGASLFLVSVFWLVVTVFMGMLRWTLVAGVLLSISILIMGAIPSEDEDEEEGEYKYDPDKL